MDLDGTRGELASVCDCGKVFLGALCVDFGVGVPTPRLCVVLVLLDGSCVGFASGRSECLFQVAADGCGSRLFAFPAELSYMDANGGSVPMGEGRSRAVGHAWRKAGTS